MLERIVKLGFAQSVEQLVGELSALTANGEQRVHAQKRLQSLDQRQKESVRKRTEEEQIHETARGKKCHWPK